MCLSLSNLTHSILEVLFRKIGHPKRKLVFQPSIFRGYVSFREGKSQKQVGVWAIGY